MTWEARFVWWPVDADLLAGGTGQVLSSEVNGRHTFVPVHVGCYEVSSVFVHALLLILTFFGCLPREGWQPLSVASPVHAGGGKV